MTVAVLQRPWNVYERLFLYGLFGFAAEVSVNLDSFSHVEIRFVSSDYFTLLGNEWVESERLLKCESKRKQRQC